MRTWSRCSVSLLPLVRMRGHRDREQPWRKRVLRVGRYANQAKGKMHQRPRRRDTSDRQASGSSITQLGAGWTLTACCLLGCCLSVVPNLCAAFGTVGTASTPARRSFPTNRLLLDLSESPAINSHGVAVTTALGAATTATFEDVLSQDVPEADAVDDADETTKVGVLLLNLGGPETGEDVEGFLFNLFADPDIIRLPKPLAPLQSVIAKFISKRRAPKSRAAYESIGGGSPILKYSNAQADLVAKSLKERYDIDAKTYVGMRYWYPFTEEALEKVKEDGINALVIIPLYPQFSISTSGSSLRVLQEEFARSKEDWGEQNMVHTVVPSWYDRPGYVGAMADLIKKELDAFTPEQIAEGTADGRQDCARHVLFSAHGVPQSYIEAGDPYQKQIQECVRLISGALPGEMEGVKIHLSYQSRVGPIEWLRPYTDDVLPELGEAGVKNLVVVPISFVSEHIETLEEIDIEYRELAEESGITNWRRCPALNTESAFIDDMADMVVEALSEPTQTVTEACVANNVGNLDLQSVDGQAEIQSAGVGGVGGDSELRMRMGERFNGRVAIFGVLTTLLIELLSGKPITNLLGF